MRAALRSRTCLFVACSEWRAGECDCNECGCNDRPHPGPPTPVGTKRAHIWTGIVFLHELGVHLWVYHLSLLK